MCVCVCVCVCVCDTYFGEGVVLCAEMFFVHSITHPSISLQSVGSLPSIQTAGKYTKISEKVIVHTVDDVRNLYGPCRPHAYTFNEQSKMATALTPQTDVTSEKVTSEKVT